MSNEFFRGHKFKKGKFITPINQITNVESVSWYKDRMPEYLWISLIIAERGHNEGLKLSCELIKSLQNMDSDIRIPRMSSILKMDDDKQYKFYKQVFDLGLSSTIAPLVIFLNYSNAPIFTKVFSTIKFEKDKYIKTLTDVLELVNFHQSETSTDTRFCVVYCIHNSGKMKYAMDMTEIFEGLNKYIDLDHADTIIMPRIRGFIRNTEQMAGFPEDDNSEFIKSFWSIASKMIDCNLLYIGMEEDNVDTSIFIEKVKNVLHYNNNIMLATDPLDDKFSVLLGISTYAYKRMVEVAEHNLFHAISGRGGVRVLVECCIIMKYLITEAANNVNIWQGYKTYGLGQYKLITEKIKEYGGLSANSHLMPDYMELLVGEYMRPEFIDMDTSYFDKLKMREKAAKVGEKSDYDYQYSYASQFEHALWGAIRESSLLKCDEASHDYHCVPDIDGDIKLKNVWYDCVYLMKKILAILENEYGCPEHLKISEVCNE